MALTADLITAQEALKGLSADQITALVTLSKNDENKVIGDKVKEIHDRYDADIKEITGRDKPPGVHTYENLKEVLKDLTSKADKTGGAFQKQIDDLKAERDGLLRKIKEGGEGATKEALEKMETRLADATNQIKALQEAATRTKEEYEAKIKQATETTTNLQIDHEFQKGLAGVKFKDESIIPVNVRETYVEHAKQRLREKYNPDFIETDGKRTMVLRDKATGMIVNNPANLQNPYLPAEMLLEEIKDIIDAGHVQKGAGTAPGAATNPTGGVVVSGAKNQVEADRLIRKQLAQNGIAAGSAQFQEELQKAWEANKVSSLPAQ